MLPALLAWLVVTIPDTVAPLAHASLTKLPLVQTKAQLPQVRLLAEE